MLQDASAVTAGHRREKKLEFVDTNVNFTSITALISTFANDCVIIQTYKSLISWSNFIAQWLCYTGKKKHESIVKFSHFTLKPCNMCIRLLKVVVLWWKATVIWNTEIIGWMQIKFLLVLLDEIKIKFSGKRLYPSNSVKYLGIKIDRFLHWHDREKRIAVKLNRTMHYYLNIEIM